ncbi:MAG: HAMP domain-containing histidine kinase [Acidobacteriota bacterium]|nr:HAMP domain-containing histidine kinase [Acidobacteriota bacterium]
MRAGRGRISSERIEPTRALQIGFLVLLVVCTLQLAWWIYDEFAYTGDLKRAQLEAFDRDLEAASAMLELGIERDQVGRLYPHIDLDGPPGDLRVAAAVRQSVDDARWHRLNRFVWEGVFFLVVLVAGMAILVRALRQEADLRRRQENFLAAVTHELKTPLASVKLAAETLVLRDPPPEARGRLVGRILGDADRLGVMISNILETGRLTDGKVRLAHDRLDLMEAIRESVADVEAHARARGARIEIDAAPGLHVVADAAALRSVLTNLLDNAVKAIVRDGGGRIRVRVRHEGSKIRVDVADDGRGFPPEEASRLFEKFYRTGDELRRTSEGSGLGLYIVRRLVEMQGGSVGAESDGPGRGATFTVSWPASESR